MRGIESEAQQEERKKRRGRYLAILMLIILLGSTAGYAIFANPKEKSGGGQGNVGDLGVNVNGNYVYLANSRNETANVPVSIAFRFVDYSNKKSYIVSENQAVTYELMSTLGRFSGMMQNACYGNCTENLPEKNCDDILIVWKESKENKVYQKDNCVFIEGDMRAVDAFIYKIFE